MARWRPHVEFVQDAAAWRKLRQEARAVVREAAAVAQAPVADPRRPRRHHLGGLVVELSTDEAALAAAVVSRRRAR